MHYFMELISYQVNNGKLVMKIMKRQMRWRDGSRKELANKHFRIVIAKLKDR